ncbi:CHAD domain-containing protein [bacterium]|nr:CHAD domain-containing protein [bacterium]
MRTTIVGATTRNTEGSDAMSFRFEPGEPVERGIKRMVREQIDQAIAEIDTQNLSHHERVHQVRKRCKKVRALARLARPALGKPYREINRYYRDTARPLSDIRDAQALVETFDDVDARADRLVADAFAPVRAALVARRDAAAARVDIAGLLAEAREALVAGRAALDTWHIDDEGFQAIAGGVHRTYRRGRKAMKKARRKPSPERYHEWRKRAKYLWYDLRIMRPLWPEVMPAMEDEADRLADLLGDDHDIHVLTVTVNEDPELGRVATMEEFLQLLGQRSRTLRDEAHRIGRRIYAEKPGDFVERLGRYDAAGACLV